MTEFEGLRDFFFNKKRLKRSLFFELTAFDALILV